MAIYYVDPAATGGNTGVDWSNALIDLQNAIDLCTGSGNTIYCRGEQILGASTTISVDAEIDGTIDNYNKIIGCNSSGVEDGTRFVINGDSVNGGSGFKLVDSFWMIRNVEACYCQAQGILMSYTAIRAILINCSAHHNVATGIYCTSGLDAKILYRCIAHNNGSEGIYVPRGGKYLFCVAHNNSGNGITTYQHQIFACLSYGNGSEGFYEQYGQNSGLFFNVAHNNDGNGFNIRGTSPTIAIGNRATENTGTGILIEDSTSDSIFDIGNFAVDNTTAQINNSAVGWLYSELTETSGVAGYNDPTNGDFNLTLDATMRDISITLPE